VSDALNGSDQLVRRHLDAVGLHEPGGLGFVEPDEIDRLADRFPFDTCQPGLKALTELVRPVADDDQQVQRSQLGGIRRREDQVAEQIDGRRIRPVQVFENDQHRLSAGRIEHGFGDVHEEPDSSALFFRAGRPVGESSPIGLKSLGGLVGGTATKSLGDRQIRRRQILVPPPNRDPVAHDPRLANQLANQPGLPDARLATNHANARHAGSGLLQPLLEPAELVHPVDEGGSAANPESGVPVCHESGF
jgi:hypothetical protein